MSVIGKLLEDLANVTSSGTFESGKVSVLNAVDIVDAISGHVIQISQEGDTAKKAMCTSLLFLCV